MPEQEVPPHHEVVKQQRWELLEHVNALTDRPLTLLSFVWLGLLIFGFVRGLSPLLQIVSNVIWGLFVLDFLLEILIAPHRLTYLKRHWLTALSLALPAFSTLRVLRAARLLRLAGRSRSLTLLRLLTGLNRGTGAVRHTMARRGFGYVATLTAVMTFGGAAGMFQFESPDALRAAGQTDAVQQGAGLHSYGEAVWWTGMMMTTMGSAYWPLTPEGRFLCWLLALYAFAVFGYLTATIAGYFVGQDRAAEQAAAPPDTAAAVAALRDEIASLRARLDTRGGSRPQDGTPASIPRPSENS